jgi:hypothetical protein
MKKLSILFFVMALILIAGSSSFAQSKYGIIGKKFAPKEANAFFGKVINTVTISKAELKEALSNAKNYIYLSVRDNKVVFMDGNKKSLLPNSEVSLAKATSDSTEITYGFSTGVVEELVSTSTEDTLTVEVRTSTLTLSSSLSTLEMSTACPPICVEE